MTTLFLTCSNKEEADEIVSRLLSKRLIACAKLIPTNSTFWWEGKIENEMEFLVIMESEASKFGDIEEVVLDIHSYETPVLTSYNVTDMSGGVDKWLHDSIH